VTATVEQLGGLPPEAGGAEDRFIVTLAPR
jgi:hypothetical protein